MKEDYLKRAEEYLDHLCNRISNRHPGSEGNQQSTAWVFQKLQELSWNVRRQNFNCLDWQPGNSRIQVSGKFFDLKTGPYSFSYNGSEELIQIASINELKKCKDLNNKILLLTGEIAAGQLFPRNYPFYFPNEHKEIYELLDEKKPVAVIAATGKNPEVAGSVYPFPMFEDGSFDIPNAYLKDIDGAEMAKYSGQEVLLKIDSARIPSTAENIIALKGDSIPRIIVTAHIDTKKNTPGALDNASGIVVLLLLAEMLKNKNFQKQIEIAVLNGEDYYAASGEMEYIRKLKGNWQDIELCINIDAAGSRDHKIAVSHYNCSNEIIMKLKSSIEKKTEVIFGGPWYMGDHMIFSQNQVPSIAITSDNLLDLCRDVTHTPVDDIEQVDPALLVEAAEFIADLLEMIK